MARIRTIKPELGAHEGLFDLEKETGLPIRFAWCMLFTVADREGRFTWRPRTLKAQILPHDDLDFSRVLDAWATRGFIQKYRVKGQWYGWIPTFTKHQVINNRESPSDIPPISHADFIFQSLDACSTRERRDDDASATREVHALVEGKEGREGKEGNTDGRVSDACPHGSTGSGGKPSEPEQRLSQAEMMAGLDRVKGAYPKVGRWVDWGLADRNCQRLIEEHGQTWETLEAAAKAFARHCDSGGVSGAERVMNPEKFFAVTRDGPWSHDWQPVAANGAGRRKTVEDYDRESAARLAQLPGEDPGPL